MGTYQLTWDGPEFYTEYICRGDYSDVNILYKYRSWKDPNHRQLLRDSVIYLASPETFEDKLDCHVPEDFPTIDELPEFFLDKSYEQLPPDSSISDRIAFSIKWCKESPLADPIRRQALADSLHREYCRMFGVLSLTGDEQNPKMWEKYADDHSGFCIGYNKKILEEYVGGAGPVIYTDDLPHIKYFKDDTMTQHIKNVFFKLGRWSFENEYRVHKLWPKEVTQEQRKIPVPTNCIEKVILGSKISKQDRKEITELLREKYPHAKLLDEDNV